MPIEIKSREIQIVPLKDIKLNPKNRNKHPPEQLERLAEILRYQGFRVPGVISNRTGYLMAGEGRYLAAKLAGLDSMPVIYQDFESEEQEYAFGVSDNAVAAWAELDLAGINSEVGNLGPDFDLDMLGIKDFVLEPADKYEDKDADETPGVRETTILLGDLFSLGSHRLLCGDSTSKDNVETLMNGEKADMVFTDPPYKIETEGGCNGEIGASLRKQGREIDFISDFDPKDFLGALPEFFNPKRMNAYIFCNKELLPDYLNWAKQSGNSFNVLVWKKPNAIPIGDSHRPDIEYLLLFRRSAIWNNGLDGVNYSRLIEHGRETGLHPTMKPVAIIENQLRISSNKGSIVAEPFLGSGSTLIACEKTNRKCYGMEIDPQYCQVIIDRWEKFTGQKAVKISSGDA